MCVCVCVCVCEAAPRGTCSSLRPFITPDHWLLVGVWSKNKPRARCFPPFSLTTQPANTHDEAGDEELEEVTHPLAPAAEKGLL